MMKEILQFDGHHLYAMEDGNLIDEATGTVLNLTVDLVCDREDTAVIDRGFAQKKVWMSDDKKMSYKEYLRDRPSNSLRVFIYPMPDRSFRRLGVLTEGKGNIPRRYVVSSWYAFRKKRRNELFEQAGDDRFFMSLLGRTYLYPQIIDRYGRCKELTVVSRDPHQISALGTEMNVFGLALDYRPNSLKPENIIHIPANMDAVEEHTPEAVHSHSHRINHMTSEILRLFGVQVNEEPCKKLKIQDCSRE